MISFPKNIIDTKDLILNEKNIENKIKLYFQLFDQYSSIKFYDFNNEYLELENLTQHNESIEINLNKQYYKNVTLYHNKNTELFFEEVKITIHNFNHYQDYNGLYKSYFICALKFYDLHEFIKSIEYYTKSYDVTFFNNNLFQRANVLNNIGNVYARMGNTLEALKSFLESEKIHSSLNNESGLFMSKMNIAICYSNLGRNKEAIDIYQSSILLSEKIFEGKYTSIIYNNLGSIYMSLLDYKPAIHHFILGINCHKESNETPEYTNTILNLAECYFNTNQIELAFPLMEKGMKLSYQLQNYRAQCMGILLKIKLAFQDNNESFAIKLAIEGYQIAKNIHFENTYRFNEILHDYYVKINDYKNAYNHLLEKEKAAKDSLELKSNNEFQYLIFEHQQEQKEAIHKATEKILYNILPKAIADRIKLGETEIIDKFDNVSCLFADIVGFTTWSSKHSVHEIANLLNLIFNSFDELCDVFHVEKIKTIGDAYMCATGLHEKSYNHAIQIINFALAMQDKIIELFPNKEIELRIGIHSGEVIAGVLGKNKYAYDLWGDTINTASRMESNGNAGKINVSSNTYLLAKEQFHFSTPRLAEIKGKGKMEMYHVVSKKRIHFDQNV